MSVKEEYLPRRVYKRFGKHWDIRCNLFGTGQGDECYTLDGQYMAIIANRGYYIKPHLVKGIGEKKDVKRIPG
ncbi:hypothetical protein CS542_04485 [Pedobacter sp. IW39]|nr:hypothetical protein CS542_04485 [Pedobacter sp. IW39]